MAVASARRVCVCCMASVWAWDDEYGASSIYCAGSERLFRLAWYSSRVQATSTRRWLITSDHRAEPDVVFTPCGADCPRPAANVAPRPGFRRSSCISGREVTGCTIRATGIFAAHGRDGTRQAAGWRRQIRRFMQASVVRFHGPTVHIRVCLAVGETSHSFLHHAFTAQQSCRDIAATRVQLTAPTQRS